MRHLVTIAALLPLLLAGSVRAGGSDPSALPPSATGKVAGMPDLTQTGGPFRALPSGGGYHCGPVATANVLIYLDGHGYPELVPGEGRTDAERLWLVQTLSSSTCMRTDRHRGTGPRRLLAGIDRYVASRGYRADLAWQGWRSGGSWSVAREVDPGFLARGVLGDFNVVLHVGWYRHDEEAKRYRRVGGHYMTLVGYRKDGGKLTFLVEDPAPRAGRKKITHEVTLRPIPEGDLLPRRGSKPIPAVGHFLVEGVVVKSIADVAILDGAARLRVLPVEGGTEGGG